MPGADCHWLKNLQANRLFSNYAVKQTPGRGSITVWSEEPRW